MPPEMPNLQKNAVLVAIDPTRTGFAFAILEAPRHLVDRGQRTARPKSGDLVRKVNALLSKHYPAVLVLEDLAAPGARRRKRARREIRSLARLALKRGVKVRLVSRLAVRAAFAPEQGKYEVAVRLAEIFPELRDRLPWKRKVYMPEDPRMNVFDAVGLAAALVARPAETPRPASLPQAA
jgi:hypothetical protein